MQNFKTLKYKDAIYFGQVKRKDGNLTRERVGKGVMIYQNGRVYEGNWLNDLRHGSGYE